MSGAEIKTLRAKFGMAQAVLARALGMSKESVSKWERGKKNLVDPHRGCCVFWNAKALRF